MRYHKFDLVISLNRLSDIRKRRFIVKRHPIHGDIRMLHDTFVMQLLSPCKPTLRMHFENLE